jgi:hypothetical protein
MSYKGSSLRTVLTRSSLAAKLVPPASPWDLELAHSASSRVTTVNKSLTRRGNCY